MNEIWKDIPGYGDRYQASNTGQIRSKDKIVEKVAFGLPCKQFYKGAVLRQQTHKWGHKLVRIGVNKEKITLAVHRAVMLAFVGPPLPGQECCHNDGNPSNNTPENLRWDTHAANNADRKRHGRYAVGSKHPMAKLSDETAIAIKACQSHSEAMALTGFDYRKVWMIRTGRSWKHLP